MSLQKNLSLTLGDPIEILATSFLLQRLPEWWSPLFNKQATRFRSRRSTHLPSKPLSFYAIYIFVHELVNALENPRIEDGFDLFGHLWGRMLGLEFDSLRRYAIINAFLDDVSKGPVLNVADLNRSTSPYADIAVAVTCIVVPIPGALNTSHRRLTNTFSKNPLSTESEPSTEISAYCPHCAPADIIERHIVCSNILVLRRTEQSSEDLESETFTSVKEHIHCLESKIVTRDGHLQTQDTSLQHERDFMSLNDRVKLDVKISPWLLGYVCHHWRALYCSTDSLWTGVLLESLPFSEISPSAWSIAVWRVLAQTAPLHQIVYLTMSLSINKASDQNTDLNDADPDFYACLKDAILLENLSFKICTERIIFQPLRRLM
ncbi:hypothetical protein IW262DRAFT_1498240 [Armillaria fumosa]|nr:hypothetical protein IW262DRAFT_1498240 [Armillaria fumosa]